MRKLASLALSLLATLVIAPSAAAQVPTQDSVSGTGIGDFFGSFSIDVRSGPSGENPSGSASFDSGAGLLTGAVSCLGVRGNVATFDVPETIYGPLLFEVTDNAALGLPDGITAGFPQGPRLPTDCSPLTSTVVGESVLSGDIVVVDAPPLPTSTAQCKNGGWQQFGFQSQGRCVAFLVLTRICDALERHGIHLKFCPPTPPGPLRPN